VRNRQFPENNGGTSLPGQQALLEKLGIPAHVETNLNMEQLAQKVEQGKGVITGVNADELWGQNPIPASLVAASRSRCLSDWNGAETLKPKN